MHLREKYRSLLINKKIPSEIHILFQSMPTKATIC